MFSNEKLKFTSVSFFTAHIPLFLYPFLHTTSKTRPFEYLRLTSLGVVGALVKVICTIFILIFLDVPVIVIII